MPQYTEDEERQMALNTLRDRSRDAVARLTERVTALEQQVRELQADAEQTRERLSRIGEEE